MTPQQHTIRRLIAQFAPADGDYATAIEGLSLFRRSAPTAAVYLDYKPSLAFVAQGAKSIILGNEQMRYGGNEYLLVSIGLPVLSQVTEASADHPYLCFLLDIDMLQIAAVYNEIGAAPSLCDACDCGMGVSEPSAPLLDAIARLMGLLATPQAIAVLAPLIKKEIVYHLLTGPQGARLIRMASVNSQTHQIGKAVEWIKENFARPLRIDELAARVNMSVSSLHHQFKALTAMTPMQYQKLLRLEGARRLMLFDMVDAGAAGYRVGYESASQFSREYARQYGQAPGREIAQARSQLLAGNPAAAGAGVAA